MAGQQMGSFQRAMGSSPFSWIEAKRGEVNIWQESRPIQGIREKGGEVKRTLAILIATEAVSEGSFGQLDLVHGERKFLAVYVRLAGERKRLK